MQERKVAITADEANLALAGVLTLVAWATGNGWLIYCGLGVLWGLLLNASLADSEHSSAWQRWDGFSLGWWWMVYEWLPESIASYPVLGTLTRVVYIMPIGFWMVILLGPFGLLLAVVGLAIADIQRSILKYPHEKV